MSSHHIVKEDQEPALVIEAMDSIPSDLLYQLLEWNPIVTTDEPNLRLVTRLGVKVDVLVTERSVDLPQDHIQVVPLNDSFLESALSYLITRGCRAANILSSRADPALLLQHAADIQLVLLSNGQRIFPAKSGFTKWKPKGERIFTYSDPVIETKGLYQLNERAYVTTSDGLYSIKFAKPYGLVGEAL